MIERELQKELLHKMKSKYPDTYFGKIGDLSFPATEEEVAFNLAYLEEQMLIARSHVGWSGGFLTRPTVMPTGSEKQIKGVITAKGIDFLENDGGLTAALSVVTVKLHADTIRDLIDAKILESAAIPEHEKPALRDALKGMKEESLKQLTTRLISHGLDQSAMTAQQLWQWIGS